MTTAVRVAATRDVRTLIGEMDHEIGEALRLGNALAAIEGIGKMSHMEPEDEISALRALLFETCGAIKELRGQRKELFSAKPGAGPALRLPAL
jgi:hypothetical protein